MTGHYHACFHTFKCDIYHQSVINQTGSINQHFRLFHVLNLSNTNFLIFLLMHPGSLLMLRWLAEYPAG